MGAAVIPAWIRNDSITISMMYVTGNLTGDDTTTPAYIKSTVTLRNVTVLDNGTVYRCGIGLSLSNSSTLTVVGK